MSSLVLLVDDDPHFMKLGRQLLGKRKWDVCEVSSTESAIDFMKSTRPQIVVTDIQMPGQDGLALIEHTVKSLPEIPVVVLTGTGDEMTAVKSFRLGAADYVRKESIQTELLPCIAKLLREEAEIEHSIQESNSERQPALLKQNTGVKTPSDQKSSLRENLEREYIIRQWGEGAISASAAKAQDREICEQRLRVLRRQVERLDKWSAISDVCLDKRQETRHPFADVVHLFPIDKNRRPVIDKRFACFCRNISAKGCSIIRNGLLREKEWGIFFPHCGPLDSKSICFNATMVRDKPIPLGMYEMGFVFAEPITLSTEDIILMQSRRKTPLHRGWTIRQPL
jgi:DNA-binding response OmpR family regulator